MPEPSNAILEGFRSLEELNGIELRSEPTWDPDDELYHLEVALSANPPDGSAVPSTSRWFVLVSVDYPLGGIDVLPSREGSLTQTFQHQLNNSTVGTKPRRWRPGKLCLDTGTAALDRHGRESGEPRGAATRLAWHLERARVWLARAAAGELALPGDPFELPDYRPGGKRVILFHEHSDSLAAWRTVTDTWGRVVFGELGELTLATSAFTNPSGETLFAPAWGKRLAQARHATTGLWVLASAPICDPPWQAPMTWGVLCDHLASQDIHIMSILRQAAESLRDGRSHYLLLGFPVPRQIGGEPARLHWVGLTLPTLTVPGQQLKGFRNSGPGLWRYDQSRSFRPDVPVAWVPTENGGDAELKSRGSLSAVWQTACVVCIGVGALGSAVAELLVRGGARDVILCDAEELDPGNLVRHVLTCTDLGRSKAEALADRLNAASPNGRVTWIAKSFPPGDAASRELLARANIVVDCSANDDVLHHLAKFPFHAAPAAFIISFGAHAKRLFLYGGSSVLVDPAHYLDWIDPWLELERRERGRDGNSELRPSIGCWHPAFPGRPDHVWLLAGTGVGWMNDRITDGTVEAREVFCRENLELKRESLPDA